MNWSSKTALIFVGHYSRVSALMSRKAVTEVCGRDIKFFSVWQRICVDIRNGNFYSNQCLLYRLTQQSVCSVCAVKAMSESGCDISQNIY